MEKEKIPPKIWEGKKKAFLVCDESFKDSNAPFLEFLRQEGYTYGARKGNYGCRWVHVDITTKQYAYGMPGVEVVGPIGNHAITIDEFMTIYKIFKKYEGLDLLKMNQEEQDAFDKKCPTSKIKRNNSCDKLTHETLHNYICSGWWNREMLPWEHCGMQFQKLCVPMQKEFLETGIYLCNYNDEPYYFGIGLAEPEVTDDMLKNGHWRVYTWSD